MEESVNTEDGFFSSSLDVDCLKFSCYHTTKPAAVFKDLFLGKQYYSDQMKGLHFTFDIFKMCHTSS